MGRGKVVSSKWASIKARFNAAAGRQIEIREYGDCTLDGWLIFVGLFPSRGGERRLFQLQAKCVRDKECVLATKASSAPHHVTETDRRKSTIRQMCNLRI